MLFIYIAGGILPILLLDIYTYQNTRSVLIQKAKESEMDGLNMIADSMSESMSVISDISKQMYFDEKIEHMSGGQKKRVALVRALLTPADILVLDEPTNHLDNEMSEWLEEYLIQFRGAILMVTHDRYFLDKVTNKILEISHGKVYSYDANYSGYLELKMQPEGPNTVTNSPFFTYKLMLSKTILSPKNLETPFTSII